MAKRLLAVQWFTVIALAALTIERLWSGVDVEDIAIEFVLHPLFWVFVGCSVWVERAKR